MKLRKMATNVLDFITLGRGMPAKVNGVRLKLPTHYYRLFPKNYEHLSFEFFKKHAKKGDTVLDIGAHIGLFSIFFSKLTGGKVYSFEPTPQTVKVLRKTVDINNCDDSVTVIEAAVSEKPGQATFYTSDENVSTSNSLVDVDFKDGHVREGAYQVLVVSVDEFRKQHGLKIDILKIDAEGVELEVLKGASKTFLEDRPIAILGLHPFAYDDRRQMLETIWNKLTEYRMRVQKDGKDISREEFINKQDFVFDVELLPI
jgi:FkbM family methyltransferase